MKKHGQRMELAGALALFVLAMASDGGHLEVGTLILLVGLSIGLILLGDLFTRPRRKHRHSTTRRQPGRTMLEADLGRAA